MKARQEVTELKAIFGSNGKVYNIVRGSRCTGVDGTDDQSGPSNHFQPRHKGRPLRLDVDTACIQLY